MRTFATKQTSNQDSAYQKPVRATAVPVMRSHSVSPLSTGMPLLQRKCACGGGCPRCQAEQDLEEVLPIQTKLKISQPGDKYEQEADRVAEQVMRMPEPLVQSQMKPKEEDTLQTKTTSSQLPTLSSTLQNQISALQGGGQPLPPSEQAFFEPRFGADFSQVRVHADRQAAETASAVNACAFTLGRDIVFGAGQYQPTVSKGRCLLAHELTHVVQQTSNIQSSSESITMNSLGDLAERETNVIATEILGDGQVEVLHGNTPHQLQRLVIPSPRTPQSGLAGSAAPASSSPSPPCPTSAHLDTVRQFNHSNLSATNQANYRTYLGALTRMTLRPGPDHTGHCMKEQLSLVSTSCPNSVVSTLNSCSAQVCLPINQGGSDARTGIALAASPNSFLDIHRTRSRGLSLLEGTGVNSCSITCAQQYYCDSYSGPLVAGLFHITRNFQASTFTPPGGTPVHITTGTVTKTQELTPGEKGDFPLRTLPEGLEYA